MNKLVVLAIVLVAAIVGAYIWWSNGLKAPQPQNTQTVSFVIPPETSIRGIGNDLKSQGLIKDPVVFFLYVKKEGIDREIQAGSHLLSPSMTLPELINELQTGSIDIWVTIIEGQRAEEVSEQLESKLDNYQADWEETLIENEGRLYPDSYLIPRDADIEDVLRIINNNFELKLTDAGIDLNDPNLQESIIIASLIEREALTEAEMPIISSVINNRINSGMALDIDATLQYAKGKDRNGKWWTVPTGQDTQLDSEYNTYLYPGLPPGPIGSPGVDAILAAMNPESTNYYFYIHDNDGKVHFSETLDEHNQNIEQYLN